VCEPGCHAVAFARQHCAPHGCDDSGCANGAGVRVRAAHTLGLSCTCGHCLCEADDSMTVWGEGATPTTIDWGRSGLPPALRMLLDDCGGHARMLQHLLTRTLEAMAPLVNQHQRPVGLLDAIVVQGRVVAVSW